MVPTKSGGQPSVVEINCNRSESNSHDSWRISYASIVLSSRIRDSARILAFSSLGGSSASKFAISLFCCLRSAPFLFEAIWNRWTAILSWDFSWDEECSFLV